MKEVTNLRQVDVVMDNEFEWDYGKYKRDTYTKKAFEKMFHTEIVAAYVDREPRLKKGLIEWGCDTIILFFEHSATILSNSEWAHIQTEALQ